LAAPSGLKKRGGKTKHAAEVPKVKGGRGVKKVDKIIRTLFRDAGQKGEEKKEK